MVLHCPKVNYKINYQPGYVTCPRTKKLVAWSKCKEKAELYTKLTVEEKLEMKHVQLDDEFYEEETQNELIAR